jgi:hypothetical protein
MKINWPSNSGKTAIAVGIFVTICIAAWATKCHGEGIAVSVGSAVLRGPTPALQVEWQWPAFEHRDAHWETGITMMGSSTFRGDNQTNSFAWDATFVDGFGPVDIGIGPAYVQNTDVYNHEGANYHLMLGYHYKRWFVRYNHFSNAGSKQPNLGRDLVLVGAVL